MSDQLPVGQVAISAVHSEPVTFTGTIVRESSIGFKTLEQLEREHIEHALKTFENNKSKTSQALGITVKTLYNKLHYYGLFEKYASAK